MALDQLNDSTEVFEIWNPKLYNDKHSFVYQYGEELIKLLSPKSHERILDLGCGLGQLSSKIREFAKEVIGIDKSSEMISEAKLKYPDINFQVMDASDFYFENKFDAIFSNAALHWVTNYKGAIRSMFDNLNPKGRIVLEFGGKGNVQTIINQVRKSLASRGYEEQSRLMQWYFPSIGEYATELESIGFKVSLAQQFDRPTELADENTGIKDWITMFGDRFFNGVLSEYVEDIKDEVQEKVRDRCLFDGKWFADYKRLRIVAVKE